MAQSILTVRDLTTEMRSAQGNIPIVEGMNLELYEGNTLALLGESGCGKSMTALSLMRVLPTPPMLPSLGEVLYRGENLLQWDEKAMRRIRGNRIAMIFQDASTALNPVLTIADQFFEVLHFHLGVAGKEAVERVIVALREVGISAPEQRMWEYPHQLSGGMRQRVMIAMALLCEPEILIADEPTTALDVTIQAQVLELMKELQQKRGMAILLITHDMGVVAEMADDVIVMYASKEVERGGVEQLFDTMAHPYTQALFASLPHPRSLGRPLPSIPGTVPPAAHYPSGCRFHPRCSLAMDVCQKRFPPKFSVGEKHETQCWLYDNEEERV